MAGAVRAQVRIRRQRAAALAQPQYYPDPNQGTYGGGQTGPPPMQYTGTGAAQYPAPSAWGPGGPTQQHQVPPLAHAAAAVWHMNVVTQHQARNN